MSNTPHDRCTPPRVATEFPTQEALDTYLKKHPKADKSKHSVKLDHDKHHESDDYKSKKHPDYYPQKAPAGLKEPPEVKSISSSLKGMMSKMPDEDLEKDKAYNHPAIKALSKDLQKKSRKEVLDVMREADEVKSALYKKYRSAKTDEEADQYRFPMRRMEQVWRACNDALGAFETTNNKKKATMNTSNAVLRKGLIRLAHEHPEFRKDILPLLADKAACGMSEGPMQGKFEEGKPADPTEQMSEEDAKEWELNTLKHKDKFKAASTDVALRKGLIRLAHEHPEFRGDILPLLRTAGCEKLPEALRKNCEEKTDEGDEKKEASSKTAGMAMVRKMITIAVRILQQQAEEDGWIRVHGQMSIDFGGDLKPDAVRFTARVFTADGAYVVTNFMTQRAVSGGGADILLDILGMALQEAFVAKGAQLLGPNFSDLD